MQEVAKLRRSLDDAEGLSRDTKKDWAVLRSQNITLEEKVVSDLLSHVTTLKVDPEQVPSGHQQFVDLYFCIFILFVFPSR